ncbi:hypothetical protein [Phormidium sp. CCY1219]|uniref:hypothetical protein n=1 Tax=Phormidium sp. CCY1219 TaxID=2886104 RepID=UPI002D1ED325|nr:hypothetical protein [Phormidium sp. CCY1219]MEB3828918.1 hypothetical protein [Phormidium sp. CCY1219]
MTAETSWLKLSVADFFSQCNWQGQSLATRGNGDRATPTSRLSLSVADYFRLLPWEGTPEVGSVPKVSAALPPKDSEFEEVTLGDLLDAF